MWLTCPTHLTHSRKWAKSCETCIARAAISAATCNRTQRQPMPKYRPTPPEQPKGVHNDEEESFDWGDVAEDSSDREQASGLQALLAASPENLTDDAIDYTVAADPELASEPGTLQEGTFFVGPSVACSRLRRQQWIAEKLGQDAECDLPVHAKIQPLAKDLGLRCNNIQLRTEWPSPEEQL